MKFLSQISVPLLIIFAGFFALEFAVPIALGEFFAGIIGGFFLDIQKVPWLKYFSHLGVLSIMFLAGFEMDEKILRKNLRTNILVGLLSFFLPFAAVCLVALIAGIDLAQAVILGIALSTTSLAIVFSVLRENIKTSFDQRQILLGSAMVVDMLSVLLFTVVFIRFTTEDLIFAAVLIVSLVIIKRVVVALFRRYKGNLQEFELKFLLLILLSLGFLAEEIGIHAAIIAFVLGIILSSISTEHGEINDKLSTIVFSLLAPIFFFHSGVLLQFKTITTDTWLLFIIFATVAISGKYFGTYLGLNFVCKCGKNLVHYGGIIFNYRLSFGIITAVAAFERGAISVQVFNIAMLTIAFSAIVTTIVDRSIGGKKGRKKVISL